MNATCGWDAAQAGVKGELETVEFILSQVRGLMQTVRDNYSVDPVVFLVIYFAAVPFFY
jgi:hypothetical protein